MMGWVSSQRQIRATATDREEMMLRHAQKNTEEGEWDNRRVLR
jgi:predicted O-methyltransferase YrrM